MECREGCGACCIYPSISSPLPAMPDGKPERVPCPHLTSDLKCNIFGQPERPSVCAGFKPEKWMCGDCKEDAVKNFEWLLA